MKMESRLITHFKNLGLTPELLRSLEKMKHQTPTPVQEAAIMPMLNGQDVLVQAPTGTGKTAAFGIPVVENTKPDDRDIQAVILCPTREVRIFSWNVADFALLIHVSHVINAIMFPAPEVFEDLTSLWVEWMRNCYRSAIGG